MFWYPQRVGDAVTRVIQSGLSGDAVVFVHGTGGRADRWTRNLDPLAQAGYRAYALDLPGHGFATKDGGFDHSVPGYSRFLAGFLDEAGIDRVTLVGTSLGGHVAARCATENPDRVTGLVLVGSMGLVTLGEEVRGRVAKAATNQTFTAVGEKLRRVIHDPALVTDSFVQEEFLINNSPGAAESFRTLGEYIANRLDDDVAGEDLDRLSGRLPVLLVWGEKDVTIPLAVGRAAHQGIRGSRLAMIRDAAHSAYFEKPDAFNRILLDFLRREAAPVAPQDAEYA